MAGADDELAHEYLESETRRAELCAALNALRFVLLDKTKQNSETCEFAAKRIRELIDQYGQ